MIFGLEERLYRDLVNVFARYPEVEQVLIFGSRAKGTAKPSSDIDLAVMAPGMSDQAFSRLWSDLDDLPLVFKMDVLHLERLNKPKLENSIMAEGQFFYPLSMEHLLTVRETIYNAFQAGPWIDFLVSAENQPRYAAYYMSMYLLQDTGEALYQHRRRGFGSDALHAYLEFWGVMQALFIQQDAICELYEAVKGCKLQIKPESAWSKLREFRNRAAGHPAKRDRGAPLTRTFMARGFGQYPAINVCEWHASSGTETYSTNNLAAMIDAYEKEATTHLQEVLTALRGLPI